MIFDLLQGGGAMLFSFIAALALAITIHEFAHALSAYLMGDTTARDAGRLTLNPLAHLDPLGTIMLLFAGFGWGKPTPYNPYQLKFRRYGPLFVALAGPFSNALGAVVSLVMMSFLFGMLGADNLLIVFLTTFFLVNVMLMIFNLIPIPPLDGSQIFFSLLPDEFDHVRVTLARNGPWLLLMTIIVDRFTGANIFGSIYLFFLRFLDRFIRF